MVLAVRLPEEMDKRLENIAKKTHRSKTYYVKEAIQAYLDAHERELEIIAEYEEQVRNGTLKTISFEEMIKRLGFEKNDLED
jgi:RHH-type rel operon transcriptional repressor/antitoxin RelB